MEKLSYEFVKDLFDSVYSPWYKKKYGVSEVDEPGFEEYLKCGPYPKEIKSLIEEVGLEFVDQQGGWENGSRDCFTIIKYNGEFYKTTYWYASHHGFDGLGNDFVKVKPKTIEKIVYE